ncbi:RDD family protein [Pseudoalteromonas sp. S1609]|uniref:RDD family protein n=1 Tax=unclassified Pseudoalteromonas TaxID=194690 RepID=UPI00110A496F|nr:MULTISPECIES: RDD family protein [unclassified Pseudoalteromonas]MDN3487436.1 RDD family protein [Pseudoalteromonas sp. APC 3224]TMP73059.1 RDD family protein [Pseudoalteromonas sp. S1609]
MKAQELEQLALSKAETREVITPYAFKVDNALLGLPLASPTRRVLAMIIDVALIFLAAKLSATIIAFVAAMAFYKGTAQQYLPKMSSVWRRILKIVAASILFVSALAVLSIGIDYLEGDDSDQGLTVQGLKIQDDIQLTSTEKKQVNAYLVQTADESCEQSCQQNALDNLIGQVPKLAEMDDLQNPQLAKAFLQLLVLGENNGLKLAQLTEDKPAQTTTHSILQWGKGIIQDLGLGFGWAAVYFTLFSLLWRGQTPGKKLCNTRVVALSGESLGLLDCFGRYGGYGAGFATGLLGFLQVYWDPNRQAIQDKISATVVIQGNVNQVVNVQTVEETVKS